MSPGERERGREGGREGERENVDSLESICGSVRLIKMLFLSESNLVAVVVHTYAQD